MANRVSLSRLKLGNFRNYESLALDLDARHVVLTGDGNGSGKTNLMEAVSFLSPGRGSGARPMGMFRVSAGMAASPSLPSWRAWRAMSRSARARMPARTARAAACALNGTPARTVEELLDHCRVLWLTPAMDGLFTGTSSDRRRFLDRLVLSLDAEHGAVARVRDRSAPRSATDCSPNPVPIPSG